MSHVLAFRTDPRKHANQRAAKEAEEAAQVEAQIKRLVAALPTQAAFDAWIDGFPAEYQPDMRRRFARFCAFECAPRTPVRQQKSRIILTDEHSTPKRERMSMADDLEMGRLLEGDDTDG